MHCICKIVEKMGPLRGDGNGFPSFIDDPFVYGREDGSPSWGRKPDKGVSNLCHLGVEKMCPLRGDGNGLLPPCSPANSTW